MVKILKELIVTAEKFEGIESLAWTCREFNGIEPTIIVISNKEVSVAWRPTASGRLARNARLKYRCEHCGEYREVSWNHIPNNVTAVSCPSPCESENCPSYGKVLLLDPCFSRMRFSDSERVDADFFQECFA